MLKILTCPLCSSEGETFYTQEFHRCSLCLSIFRHPRYFLSTKEEKTRYEKHHNDVQDSGYQDFVIPIVKKVLKNHTALDVGLDFGAGTGPVISHLLGKKGLHLQLYDPFFHNQPELLKKKYDFIIACEVVEHFHHPKKEFQLLYNLLKPGGKLYIMTNLYTSEINFTVWYYKNDPTHVFFYTQESFQWIQNNWNWKECFQENRCVTLKK